ncbi:MAG: hypothetical protein M1825_003696 [Sarcosagium campestre]|nr:MAG: hypothetical protein M1825_003696 [Sarcosagium campestre]
MAPHELREEYAYEAQALPARTPSRSFSRHSSRFETSSQVGSSSPPPMPSDRTWLDLKDTASDETLSPLDPRRFTPTLHASLVSEILSLRRELDSKIGLIESLEVSIEKGKSEFDDLNSTLTNNGKETRSLRRQLQLLEGGTSSALSELARERDEAVESSTDLRRRLELSQKKIRSQEEDSDRVQGLWDRDRQRWESDRRNMERKVHVVEGRLKAILEEVAAQQQAAAQVNGQLQEIAIDSDGEEAGREDGFGHGSDTASIRSAGAKGVRPISAMSNDSVRSSTLSGVNGLSRLNGLSLADELENDVDEDGTADEAEADGKQITSGEEGPARTRSHVKSPSLLTIDEIVAGEKGAGRRTSAFVSNREADSAVRREVAYVDAGTQFSPPPSPKLEATPSPLHPLDLEKLEDRAASPTDHEPNSRRKRVSATKLAAALPSQISAIPEAPPLMVSTSSQTSDAPPSPLKTALAHAEKAAPPQPSSERPEVEMVCTATQTDDLQAQAPKRAPPPPPIPVPSIAIYPPTSAPSTPGIPLLPSRTKNAACQTSQQAFANQRSVSVQTEEIRIDKRSVKLPPNLLPSAISSAPPTPDPGAKSNARVTSPRLNNRQTIKKPTKKSVKQPRVSAIPSSPPRISDEDSFRADKANGAGHGAARPFRSSNVFAGFDIPSSDEADEFEAEQSESDYRTALSAPRHSKAPKPGRAAPRPLSSVSGDDKPKTQVGLGLLHQLRKVNGIAASDENGFADVQSVKSRISTDKQQQTSEKGLTLNTTRHSFAKRPGLFGGGPITAQRARSPSLGDVRDRHSRRKEPLPPFPVPTRSSSRRIPISISEGAQSPSLPGGGSMHSGYNRESLDRHYNSTPIRKVRSAAAIARNGRPGRHGSPPPMSPSSGAPSSPQLPPMPRDEVTTPRNPARISHKRQRSNNTTNTGGGSVGSSGQSTTVVDAIAQTMVGEWMWKYVRRRKSFGVPENAATVAEAAKVGEDGAMNMTGTGTRHKRWVWLAPYERAVMWSSKQPTSGTALLGKSGRKLVIQSVLDVRDETPMPKGAINAQGSMNRSILILTSARALKFTATSLERHYVWLTALSFLSRSGQDAPELLPMPPVPQQPYEPTLSVSLHAPGLRRNNIRDSIRVAKGRPRPMPLASSSRPSQSSVVLQDGRQDGEAASTVDEPAEAAADPPIVPRFSAHGRKRSNTGGRAPLSSFRSFSHQPMPSSTHSFITNGSSEIYGNASSLGGIGINSGQSSISHRTSEASGGPPSNFFDAVGTVRMEAFVQRTLPGGGDISGRQDDGARGAFDMSASQQSKAELDQYWKSQTDFYGNRFQEEHVRADDPFRGF